MKLHHDRGITWVEYITPPKPEPVEGDNVIEIPEKEGTPVVIITHENGMTNYLFRESWDYDAAARYVAAIQEWAYGGVYMQEIFIGLPLSINRDESIWFSRLTLEKTLNIHNNVVTSPLAVHESRGKSIVVPMGEGTVKIPIHGDGKRKR